MIFSVLVRVFLCLLSAKSAIRYISLSGNRGISPLGYADPDIHACGIPEHTTPQSLDLLAGITILVSE